MIKLEFADLDEMMIFAKRLVGEVGKVEVSLQPVVVKKEKPQLQKEEKSTVQEEEPNADNEQEGVSEDSTEQTYTLEDVRAKLAELNKSGKRLEVKALLEAFGAEKLSEISPDQYGALMEKVGKI